MTTAPAPEPGSCGRTASGPLRLALLPAPAPLIGSGGATAHAAALAAGCQAAGLAVRVFAPPGMAALFGPGIGFESVRIGARPGPASDAVAVRRLRAMLRAWRPDVVHAHGVRAGALAALALLGRPGRPPLIVTVHNAPPPGRGARLVYRALAFACARRADEVLCASADLAAQMRAAGAASVSLFDVPAAANPPPSADAVAKVRAELGAAARPVVLGVGRLAPQKGFDVLVAAAARWRDRDPAPVTALAGEGPLAGELRRQAIKAGADLLLLGRRDDVPALLAAADVVVVPSRWDARALVLQEAMRAGRPIVATRVGGAPELTGDDGALLVAADDPAALAAAVTRVLDDPRLAAGLGQAAAARSSAFASEADALEAALKLYARLAHR